MKWIEDILNANVDGEGKLDKSKAMTDISTEFPKNAITKEVFNQKNDDLKQATNLVEQLKKDNKDVDDLQAKIDEYEVEVDKLKATRIEEKKSYTLKEQLKDAGAKDVEYMIYKLGDVETNEEGELVDLGNKLKELRETNPDFFAPTGPGPTNPAPDNKGYQTIDNALDTGKETKTYSREDLGNLSTEEINENWDAVSSALEEGED